MLKYTRQSDPEIAALVDEELNRQEHNIEMIASESTAPLEVMELSGSVFTNKTLEGYPGRRFQAGSEIADKVEKLAWERAKELFGAEHVNIQSYSGSTANYSVFASVLNPGDKILAMRLDQGGHLTHGSPANWVSKIYNHVFYGVDKETERIDYDALDKLAKEEKPKMIIAGASSYPRLIDYERIAKIAEEVGAYFMVDMAHIAGLVAAKVIPSPIPYADFVTSSTTKTFCSARSGMVFCKEKYAKILDKGTFPGSLGSLMFHTMAAKTWSFKYAASQEFHDIMQQVVVNAQKLAEELSGYGFRIVSGGTDNHLLVVDLRGKGITGTVFQDALDAVGITVNKNMIPFDPEKPSVTSGVRIGLTSVTQRGLKEPEIVEIASIMNQVAEAPTDEANLAACKERAEALISKFPLYPAGAFED
ncbi:serine hydroxymethyltransferase [Lactonifactor longoviformis]|uniref:2-methylserine hydroxymethyltransferase n=1 Tax=Lactonifactor longoviformis DSM 17459 TaxID=1122155 RepID=A0A1M4TAP0_9CLOT|nr:serine hydroxymethyltransferase [Lactonifactor longoviformis]POP34677.1 serine hydroxymethyltransferase [Lactonifactor longoviformis]SHE41531.1 glycine hydroxymethyltransferase [Lactonifactor longoviformis DSM 17459]